MKKTQKRTEKQTKINTGKIEKWTKNVDANNTEVIAMHNIDDDDVDDKSCAHLSYKTRVCELKWMNRNMPK